jgi:carbohydrate-selective porin OprB
MATPRGPYTWDARSRRYRSAQGRFVSAAAVRAELDKSIDAAGRAMREASDALREGRMSLAAWELRMAEEIRNSHLASTALAKGGWSRMTPSDYGRAGREIRRQYEYLRKFAAQIASGQQKLDGTLGRRAELYLNAARGQYEETRRRDEAERGMDEEARIRHARDSCDTCITEAAKGWQPIGTLRAIGDGICLSRCKCTFIYRAAEVSAAA